MSVVAELEAGTLGSWFQLWEGSRVWCRESWELGVLGSTISLG